MVMAELSERSTRKQFVQNIVIEVCANLIMMIFGLIGGYYLRLMFV